MTALLLVRLHSTRTAVVCILRIRLSWTRCRLRHCGLCLVFDGHHRGLDLTLGLGSRSVARVRIRIRICVGSRGGVIGVLAVHFGFHRCLCLRVFFVLRG